MFFKLAFQNVRRSLRDYTIYFLTLTFGVCIFYIFNSLDAQSKLLNIPTSQQRLIEVLVMVMDVLSVFVAVVLAFLILYANRFLMRRRKKELAIYLLLGMPKGKISGILLLETLVIGLFSLAVGLCLGVFLSQGLTVWVAQFFETKVEQFQFVFSAASLLKSILYFGIIFLLVMCFNTLSVSRCKLIDLMQAQHRNEVLKLRSLKLSVALFLLSLVSLGLAYRCILHNGMMALDREFWAAILLGSVGTVLFFLSLSGFLLRVVQSNKGLYYRNLNMFVLRQINSKINTAYLSMSVVCIMLLLTIGTFSTGFGFNQAIGDQVDNYAPYDLMWIVYPGEKEEDVDDYLQAVPIDTRYVSTMATCRFYSGSLQADLGDTRELYVVSQSDYNQVAAMEGEAPISLGAGEYLPITPVQGDTPLDQGIRWRGEPFQARTDLPPNASFSTLIAQMGGGRVVVLPDEEVQGLDLLNSGLYIYYQGDQRQAEAYFDGWLQQLRDYGIEGGYSMMTRMALYEGLMGQKLMVVFIGTYLGVVFLIASAAVLALQQLSEASDNQSRYALLRKLGVDEKMIGRAIDTQVGIYFLVPLGLAIVHSAVGLTVVNNLLTSFGESNFLASILGTAAILLVVYGGYFLATCLGCRNISRTWSSQ